MPMSSTLSENTALEADQTAGSAVKYSICICNYNMADTIEESLTSVLEQLDERFEVVVVDDASTDKSVEILEKLARTYPALRLICLKRDWNRLLGETRNISIREARGEYVILHIDTDDVWEPFIKEIVEVLHRVGACYDRDVYIQARQFGFAKRAFLLSHGPYRNTFVEDRDMWLRFADMDVYVHFDHRTVRRRMQPTTGRRILKVFWTNNFNHLVYQMRIGPRLSPFLVLKCLTEVFWNWRSRQTKKRQIARMSVVIPALMVSLTKPRLPLPERITTPQDLVDYRDRTRGTYAQIMQRHGKSPDLSFLPAHAREVFDVPPFKPAGG